MLCYRYVELGTASLAEAEQSACTRVWVAPEHQLGQGPEVDIFIKVHIIHIKCVDSVDKCL